jgi:molybdate transport repressor ModE-like protein
MIKVEIEASWRFTKDGDSQSMQTMLDLLNHIRMSGKITVAAERTGMSYRHAWNLIEKWSRFLEAPLVERRQGHGTALTPFGDRLVWAGQRLGARLKPQLENLAQELETEIRGFLPHDPSVIRVHASHGFAVAALRAQLSREAGIGFEVRYVTNQTSLVSLAQGECDLAGMHLPRGPLRRRSVAACRPLPSPGDHRVIGFVTREMGLMMRRGNPLGIRAPEDLLNPRVRFVNRDPDSGTGQLFAQLLRQHGIDGAAINGHGQIEYTHAAVAAYVASGMADVCFGVEAAARQFGLDFVRLLTEDYVFVCRKETLETEPVRRVLSVIRGPEFHAAIGVLPGYATMDCGVIKPMREVFRDTPDDSDPGDGLPGTQA